MQQTNIKNLAVFTSGGDAPGMNAAVRSVTRTANYYGMDVFGIIGGYDGMINGNIVKLENKDVANIMQRGGTILKTARSMEFMKEEGRKKAFDNLKKHNIDACVCIGGNGTYTGALKFSTEFKIPMVGLPGTIDNDLYGSDYTIGFDTAVNTAVEAIDKIRDTADAHDRLFFIEVMGRHAGYIALHSGIAGGAGNIFLPEVDTDIDQYIKRLQEKSHRQKLFNLVVVAEGNKGGDALTLANRVKELAPEFDTKVTIIGHLQRGGSPTCADRVLASRLGYNAVEALLKGISGVAIGIINDEITYTSFEDAISKTKPLNTDMMKMVNILSL
jgi:6-phosphofructokinase 1